LICFPKYRISGLILFISLSFCQEYSDSFLSIGVYPRSISLGHSIVALNNNSSGFIINPAATGFSAGSELAVMYINQFNMANLFSIHYNRSIGEKWQVGASVLSFFVGGIQERPDLRSIYDLQSRRDTVRALTDLGFDTFNDRETALYFNFTRNYKIAIGLGWWTTPFFVQMPIGINVKILNKQLYDLTGYGMGLDIGTMASFKLSDVSGYDRLGEITFGLSLTNFPETLIYWDSGKNDQIPIAVIYGIGYNQIIVPGYINGKLLYQNKTTEEISDYGLEIIWKKLVAVRLGMETEQMQGGLGMEFTIKGIITSLDYSYMAHALGNAHRFGVRLHF